MGNHKFKRRRMVAVIGDGNLPENSEKYVIARSVGAQLIESGFAVITGGLGGVMEAASRGAQDSSSRQPGTIVAVLPGCNPTDANPWADVVIPTGLDHVRNVIIAQADAVVAIGGGAGTLAEIAFAWMYDRLVVGLRVEGWSGRLADQRIDARVRYPDILDDCVFGANTAHEAVTIITARLESYNHRTQ